MVVLRQRNFSLFWFGQLVSLVGNWVLLIALPFYVFDQTGSALATGSMFIVQILPSLFLGSLAGVFVDRWDRKWVMVLADLSRSVILLILLTVNSPEWLWVIYLVALFESAISQFALPAQNAAIPNLVDKKYLIQANSLNALSDNLARLVGPSLGGALMALVGLKAVVILDSASYLISGTMIILIPLASNFSKETNRGQHISSSWAMVFQDWLEGLRLVRKDRLVTGLFAVIGTAMLADGVINVLLVAFVKDILHVGTVEFGWVMTARGVGGLVGGIIVAQGTRIRQPITMVVLGAAAVGLTFFIMFNYPSLSLFVALSVLVGVPMVGYRVNAQVLLQSNVADQYLGRIFGTLGTTNALLVLVGMGLASALGDMIGILPVLELVGGLYVLAAAIALLVSRMLRSASSV